jgi:hypothetical protein
MTAENTEEITRKGIQRELPVKLTPPELLTIAITKSKAEAERDELCAEFRDVKSDWNGRMEQLDNRIKAMGMTLRTQEERRVVTCHERFKAGTIEVVREDTGEVVERRAATMAEAQKVIPGTESTEGAAATQRANVVEEDEDGESAEDQEGAEWQVGETRGASTSGGKPVKPKGRRK